MAIRLNALSETKSQPQKTVCDASRVGLGLAMEGTAECCRRGPTVKAASSGALPAATTVCRGANVKGEARSKTAIGSGASPTATAVCPRRGRQIRARARVGARCPSWTEICRDPGSNRGPSDLQSDALPTELSRLVTNFLCEAVQIIAAVLIGTPGFKSRHAAI